MAGAAALQAHLESGLTTVCRTWLVERRDGMRFGFTDHDVDLSFEGVVFAAQSGLTALALQQTSGLAVDNTEAIGALSSAAITEADIRAGRFDGAEVTAWLVNWADVTARRVVFRGSLGDIRRGEGAFTAELRGLTDRLNQPQGRVYQTPCAAVLGDAKCGFDLDQPGYAAEIVPDTIEDGRVFRFDALPGFELQWFERGSLRVLDGGAAGLLGVIKYDRYLNGQRVLELWEPIPGGVEPGASVRIEAGCDKRFETCRFKFANQLNFRGFPHIPGDDWLMSYPTRDGANDGGALT